MIKKKNLREKLLDRQRARRGDGEISIIEERPLNRIADKAAPPPPPSQSQYAPVNASHQTLPPNGAEFYPKSSSAPNRSSISKAAMKSRPGNLPMPPGHPAAEGGLNSVGSDKRQKGSKRGLLSMPMPPSMSPPDEDSQVSDLVLFLQ